MNLSIDILRDKIHACWIGKNIGGTMGTPYEGKRELLDIQGFSTQPGESLPNDDLDLQLVWLRAVDQLGPKAITASILAEYWLSYVMPHWNEYGVGKANLRAGFFPPLSGELNNEEWKHSNGAWIRT
ncbi:MAG TPA: ADP-ribosylglycohydrolase family protein, partial [Clostridiaceae bacterium]|nr:ADP-ribosylglycohydrolase family protein [Clostridiaceae bacterium]